MKVLLAFREGRSGYATLVKAGFLEEQEEMRHEGVVGDGQARFA